MSEPAPAPSPNPNPTPTPAPSPNPAPQPSPTPDPNHNPAPSPNPAPNPTPAPEPVKGDWPENWRDLMAAGDEKLLEDLKRYSSPLDVNKARVEARKKISQGTAKPKLPDNATPEQLAEYRKEVGVPESHDKYDTALGDGHVWGDEDKPLLESFTKAAHASNIPGEYVKPMLAWYEGLQKQNLEARTLADAKFKKDNLDVLSGEWGGSLGMEARIAEEFWQSMGDDLYGRFKTARDANGNLLFADADLIRWANRAQRELNPAATVVPGSGGNAPQAMEAEMAGLKKLMGDQSSEYYKGPNAAKHQARYRELLDAKEKMGARRS